MTNLILQLVLYALIAFFAPRFIPGIRIRDSATAITVAILFVIVNLILGWLVGLLITLVSLPAIICSLGLFAILIPALVNAIVLKVVDGLMSSFDLVGWGPALILGVLFGLANALANSIR
jgi:putative membrane protein